MATAASCKSPPNAVNDKTSATKNPARPARLPPQPKPTISSSTVRTGSSASSQLVRLRSNCALR